MKVHKVALILSLWAIFSLYYTVELLFGVTKRLDCALAGKSSLINHIISIRVACVDSNEPNKVSDTESISGKEENEVSEPEPGHSQLSALMGASSVNTAKRSPYKVIVHVGPHKMSSTSLQVFLHEHANSLLIPDGYSVPGGQYFNRCPPQPGYTGPKNTANLAFRLQTRTTCHGAPDQLRQLTSFLELAFQHGNHVILSSEEFDNPQINTSEFLQVIHQSWDPPPQTYAMVYYRRFYDFFFSRYHELHRHRETRFKSFVDWATNDEIDTWLESYTMANKERYRRGGFDHVDIVPMIDLDGKYNDVTARFFCEYVPGANRTCKWFQSHQLPRSNSRIESLDLVRITYEARARNLTSRNLNMKQIRKKFESMGNDYKNKFTMCLNSTIQQRLFDLSCNFEEKMACAIPGADVDALNCTVGVRNLQSDFTSKVESNLFCSLNADQMLADKKWQAFFRSL